MKEKNGPKIKIFKNLNKFGLDAIALPWANEIHIDSKLVDGEYGDRGLVFCEYGTAILRHEQKHFEFYARALRSKHPKLIVWKNNLWDTADNFRISWHFDKKACLFNLIFSSMPILVIVVILTKLFNIW